jgi:hypothetical protein
MDWPQPVRNYVTRSFEFSNLLDDISRLDIEVKLKQTITEASDNETLGTLDWDNLRLPQEMIRQERAQATLSWQHEYVDLRMGGNGYVNTREVMSKKRESQEIGRDEDSVSTPPWRTSSCFEDRIAFNKCQPPFHEVADPPFPKVVPNHKATKPPSAQAVPPKRHSPMSNLTSTFTSTYEMVQKNGRKALRVILKGIEHLACPDSGSDKNIVSQEFATEHKIQVRRGKNDKKLFELGNGAYVKSLGRARIPCSLAKGSFPSRKQWFHVLANCAVPLIMGRSFLEESQILTKNRHLLERCPPELLSVSSLKFIGSPRNRSGMGISLNGRVLMATPDTGSDLNLISLACAEREGFYINRSCEAQQRLQVADGSEVQTVGRVYIPSLSLDWRKDQTISDVDRTEYTLEGDDAIDHPDSDSNDNEEPDAPGEMFYVIDGLPCDVILGEPFLDKTDAFNTCAELFTNYPERERHAFELKIFRWQGPVQAWLSKFSKKSTKTPDIPPDERTRQEHYAGLEAERCRRSRAKRVIDELDGSEQSKAAAVEEAVMQAYDQLHERCDHCYPKRQTADGSRQLKRQGGMASSNTKCLA